MNSLIETSRLIITYHTLEDAPFFYRLMNQQSWIKNIGDRNIKTIDNAKSHIETKIFTAFAEYGYGTYALRLKMNNVILGTCGIYNRPGLDIPDLGFAMLDEFGGNGYMFEAATAVLDYARDELGINMLAAITLPSNKRSINLLRKLRFEFKESFYLPNDSELLNKYIIRL